jgi:hypothetical protein
VAFKSAYKPCSAPGCKFAAPAGYRFCSRHLAETRAAMARDGYLTEAPAVGHHPEPEIPAAYERRGFTPLRLRRMA